MGLLQSNQHLVEFDTTAFDALNKLRITSSNYIINQRERLRLNKIGKRLPKDVIEKIMEFVGIESIKYVNKHDAEIFKKCLTYANHSHNFGCINCMDEFQTLIFSSDRKKKPIYAYLSLNNTSYTIAYPDHKTVTCLNRKIHTFKSVLSKIHHWPSVEITIQVYQCSILKKTFKIINITREFLNEIYQYMRYG
jgi:hypothetical protein